MYKNRCIHVYRPLAVLTVYVVKLMDMLYVRAKSNISVHRLLVALNVWSAANVCQTEHVSIKDVLTHVLVHVEIMLNVLLSTIMHYVAALRIMSVIHSWLVHTKKVSELTSLKI